MEADRLLVDFFATHKHYFAIVLWVFLAVIVLNLICVRNSGTAGRVVSVLQNLLSTGAMFILTGFVVVFFDLDTRLTEEFEGFVHFGTVMSFAGLVLTLLSAVLAIKKRKNEKMSKN